MPNSNKNKVEPTPRNLLLSLASEIVSAENVSDVWYEIERYFKAFKLGPIPLDQDDDFLRKHFEDLGCKKLTQLKKKLDNEINNI